MNKQSYPCMLLYSTVHTYSTPLPIQSNHLLTCFLISLFLTYQTKPNQTKPNQPVYLSYPIISISYHILPQHHTPIQLPTPIYLPASFLSVYIYVYISNLSGLGGPYFISASDGMLVFFIHS